VSPNGAPARAATTYSAPSGRLRSSMYTVKCGSSRPAHPWPLTAYRPQEAVYRLGPRLRSWQNDQREDLLKAGRGGRIDGRRRSCRVNISNTWAAPNPPPVGRPRGDRGAGAEVARKVGQDRLPRTRAATAGYRGTPHRRVVVQIARRPCITASQRSTGAGRLHERVEHRSRALRGCRLFRIRSLGRPAGQAAGRSGRCAKTLTPTSPRRSAADLRHTTPVGPRECTLSAPASATVWSFSTVLPLTPTPPTTSP
jgi:hypothetical protein